MPLGGFFFVLFSPLLKLFKADFVRRRRNRGNTETDLRLIMPLKRSASESSSHRQTDRLRVEEIGAGMKTFRVYELNLIGGCPCEL